MKAVTFLSCIKCKKKAITQCNKVRLSVLNGYGYLELLYEGLMTQKNGCSRVFNNLHEQQMKEWRVNSNPSHKKTGKAERNRVLEKYNMRAKTTI